MSNRQQRRQRRSVVQQHDDGTANAVHSLGTRVRVSADQMTRILARNPLKHVTPGEHLWCITTAFRVDPAKAFAGEAILDTENLVIVAGPGCLVCEEPWSQSIADRPCPGDPQP